MRTGIVLMSRIPRPGYTKTRLQSFLTPSQCAEFHRSCLEDEIMALRQLDWPKYFSYTDESSSGGLTPTGLESACGLPAGLLEGFEVFAQLGEDLGIRMQNAARQVLIAQAAVIIIGSDSPWITPGLMEEAASLLERVDVVLGPALDGGYYLIGLKSVNPSLFSGIPWGTDQVLRITMERIADLKLSSALLTEEQDLDTPLELYQFYQRGKEEPWLRMLASYRYLERLMVLGRELYEFNQTID